MKELNKICPICSFNGCKEMGFDGKFAFLRCNKCGVDFVDPIPSRDELFVHYDNFFAGRISREASEKLVKKAKDSLLHQVSNIKELKEVSNKKFLDIGFGGGHYLFAAQRIGFDVYGTEIDKLAFQKINGKIKNTYNCYLENAPFIDNFFDLIKSVHVLEHSNNPPYSCKMFLKF